jgi:hypothetical protein
MTIEIELGKQELEHGRLKTSKVNRTLAIEEKLTSEK